MYDGAVRQEHQYTDTPSIAGMAPAAHGASFDALGRKLPYRSLRFDPGIIASCGRGQNEGQGQGQSARPSRLRLGCQVRRKISDPPPLSLHDPNRQRTADPTRPDPVVPGRRYKGIRVQRASTASLCAKGNRAAAPFGWRHRSSVTAAEQQQQAPPPPGRRRVTSHGRIVIRAGRGVAADAPAAAAAIAGIGPALEPAAAAAGRGATATQQQQ